MDGGAERSTRGDQPARIEDWEANLWGCLGIVIFFTMAVVVFLSVFG